jgi:hypothetical protein
MRVTNFKSQSSEATPHEQAIPQVSRAIPARRTDKASASVGASSFKNLARIDSQARLTVMWQK